MGYHIKPKCTSERKQIYGWRSKSPAFSVSELKDGKGIAGKEHKLGLRFLKIVFTLYSILMESSHRSPERYVYAGSVHSISG